MSASDDTEDNPNFSVVLGDIAIWFSFKALGGSLFSETSHYPLDHPFV